MAAISWWAMWVIALYNAPCILALTNGLWDYHHQDTWGGMCNIGQAQSPVDLGMTLPMPLDPLWVYYPRVKQEWLAVNNGHSLQLSLLDGITPKDSFNIRGAALPDVYRLAQMHFHWGNVSLRGSEHGVKGKKYAGEIHFVHVREGYPDVTSALATNDSAALAVLGVFLEIGETPNPALKSLFESSVMVNVTTGHSPVPVSLSLPLGRLLAKTGGMYRYMGSLTTPACNEAVVWTLLSTPIIVTEGQMEMF
eukprot:Ihof_evm4s469 gene=Ihof_evmTU4s469